MKRIWASLISAALLAAVVVFPAAAQDNDGLTVDLDAVDDSGYSGTAQITPENGETSISVALVEPVDLDDESEDPLTLGIHAGTCDAVGDEVHELPDAEAGLSETTIDASIDELTADDHVITLERADLGLLACGEIAATADEDDEAAVEDEDDAVVDDEDDAVIDDEDDAAVDEEDDAAVDDEDDAAVEDEDDAVVDDEDDAAVEDEDDAVVDDEDDAVVDDEDPAVTDDEEIDDAEEVVPAAGSTGGLGSEAGILALTLGAGTVLGAGLLIRRRSLQF